MSEDSCCLKYCKISLALEEFRDLQSSPPLIHRRSVANAEILNIFDIFDLLEALKSKYIQRNEGVDTKKIYVFGFS